MVVRFPAPKWPRRVVSGLAVAGAWAAIVCRGGESPAPDVARTVAPASSGALPAPAPPPSLPLHPVLDERSRAARAAAQRHVLPAGAEAQPDLWSADGPAASDPSAPTMPGVFTPMQLPPDRHALAGFEAALAELEAGKRTEPVRLAFYGASGTAADLWTAYVRTYLQLRFGDGGPGLVAAARPTKWYRHHELEVASSRHWTKHNSLRLRDTDPPGVFGVMGLAMSADSKHAWTELRPTRRSSSAQRIRSFEISHLLQPGGGRFEVRIDGKHARTVTTRLQDGESPRLGYERIEVEPGPHVLRISVEGDGMVYLLGVAAETGEPGIVLDTLGVDGATIANQLRWNEAVWAESLRRRNPVLYVLAFGTNESVEEDEPIEHYEADHRAVLERFAQTVPEAGCVLIGPGDFPKLVDGELQPRPRIDEIRTIQRRLATEYGCAFWDALELGGGAGTKREWVDAGLAKDDYLHLTRAGYVRFGLAFADALLQPYDWKPPDASRAR